MKIQISIVRLSGVVYNLVKKQPDLKMPFNAQALNPNILNRIGKKRALPEMIC